MACSACGTARVPAWTAPAMRCTAAISSAPRTWRRAGGVGRRPWRAFLHLSAPDRARLPGRVHPGAEPRLGQDILDLGLAGIALSRFSGLWVAMKTTAETAEQAATLVVPSGRGFVTPDFALPPHGLNFDHRLRFPADRAELERRMVEERFPRRWPGRVPTASTGGSSAATTRRSASSPSGKAHDDTMHALRMLDLRTTRRSRSTRWR